MFSMYSTRRSRIYANDEQNFSEPQTEFQQKWFQSLTGCHSPVPELCAFLLKHPILQINPHKAIAKGLSVVMLVAMEILPQIAQDIGSTRPSPRKRHEESEVWHCWSNKNRKLSTIMSLNSNTRNSRGI